MDCSRCGKHLKTLDPVKIATHYASEGCKAQAQQLRASGGVRKISSFFKPQVGAAAAAAAGAARPSTSAAPTFQAGGGDGEVVEEEVIG
jgi:hypothetical protein